MLIPCEHCGRQYETVTTGDPAQQHVCPPETSEATGLGESVFVEWDEDGDLYLYTADTEDNRPDEFSAEIWLGESTLENLKRFIKTAPRKRTRKRRTSDA